LPSEFEPALELARHARFGEACDRVEHILAAGAHEALATPAALALAAIARDATRGGDSAAAERAFEAAVRLRPRFADLHYQYACVLITRERRMEARRALERAIAINAGYVAARVELAMLDARDGMIGEALTALRALAADVAVEDPRAFAHGMARLEHAEWDEADALIRRGLHLSSAGLAERIERFHALLREDRAAEAAEVLREVLPRHESYPDLHFLLGSAELKLGHVHDALASLGQALELHPDLHAARVQFALALDAAGMSAAALDQITLVLELEPGNLEAEEFVRAHEAHTARTGTHG
jgi:tetratricopeptide (TPR) repeat protein